MNFDRWYDQHWEEEKNQCKECGTDTEGEYCSDSCWEASHL